MDKEVRKVLREAVRQGWRVVRTRQGDYKLFPPDRRLRPVTMSPHAAGLREAVKEMEAQGFRWEGGLS